MVSARPRRRRPLRRLRRALERSAGQRVVGALTALVLRMPLGGLLRLGTLCARLGWFALGRERRAALRNLAVAFPDRSPRWRAAIGRRCFERQLLAGLVTVRSALGGRPAAESVIDTGPLLDWLERRRPASGWVLMTAHHGPSMLLASLVTRRMPVVAVARPARSPALAPLQQAVYRALGLTQTLPQGISLRALARRLRAGTTIGLLPDHDVKRLAGGFVPLFGCLAYTPLGPALLARLAQAPIVLIMLEPRRRRRPTDLRYRVRWCEIPPAANDLETTWRWLSAMETRIRADPGEWSWMNRRFRTRPTHKPRAPILRGDRVPAALDWHVAP